MSQYRMLFTAVALLTLSAPVFAEESDDSEKEKREYYFSEMENRAKATSIYFVDGAERKEATLLPKPIIRYTDVERRIVDSTIWCWMRDGRPFAFQKVEFWNLNPKRYPVMYCTSLLQNSHAEVDWNKGRQWQWEKPSTAWAPLPFKESLQPSKVLGTRLSQMKLIARHFEATVYDADHGTEKLRLLASPLFRYSDDKTGLLDGVVFGFASLGTNPSALLLLEAQENDDKVVEWRMRFVGMTRPKLIVKYDGKDVWTAEETLSFGQGTNNPWTWHFYGTVAAFESEGN